MNITAVGMTYNIQPVNKRRNNIRFTGNPEQPQQDSFTPAAKPKEVDVNQIMREVDEVLRSPDSTYQDKEQAMNRLKETGVKSAKEGNSEAVKPVMAKLISLFEKPELQDFVETALVEIAANDDMKSLEQVFQSTERLMPEKVKRLENITNKALELNKPEVAKRIVKILTEILKDPNHSYFHFQSMYALGDIGCKFLESENPEIAKMTDGIAITLAQNFSRPEITVTDNVMNPQGLDEIGNKALKRHFENINEKMIPNITKFIIKYLFRYDYSASIQFRETLNILEKIGSLALDIKNKAKDFITAPDLTEDNRNRIITNNDETAKLVISQLFKMATNPKLDQNKEPVISFYIRNTLWFLGGIAESWRDQNTTEYINNCRRAMEDLEDLEEEVEIIKDSKKEKETIRIKCKEKVREFDKAFKQENLKKLDEDSKEKLYIDLDSTIEKLKKIYKKKLKTELKYIIQRYRDYLNYFENRGSSETLIGIGSKYNTPCFHPLKKGNQTLTHDIVALISEVDNPKKDGRKSAIDILRNVNKYLIEEAKKIK